MKTLKISILTTLAAFALLVSTTASAVKPAERITLVDVAVEANNALGIFNTLIFALIAEGELIQTLDGNGQYTVFAPTDAAFADLATNVLQPAFCFNDVIELFLDQPGYVAEVLSYHVAKGRKDSGEVLPADQIRMLNGDFVTRTPGSLEITDVLGRTAMLQVPFIDIPADNGVIHVIDKVILHDAPMSNCP